MQDAQDMHMNKHPHVLTLTPHPYVKEASTSARSRSAEEQMVRALKRFELPYKN